MRKRTTFLFIVAAMAFFSCKKDDSTIPNMAPSKMDLLTRKQWIYNEILGNYQGDSASAKVLYKRGVSQDPHHDSERDIFWKDGHQDLLFDNDSSRMNATWYFSADSTHYTYVSNTGVSSYASILVLDSTHLTYWDHDHNVLGIMTAKQ